MRAVSLRRQLSHTQVMRAIEIVMLCIGAGLVYRLHTEAKMQERAQQAVREEWAAMERRMPYR